MPVVSDIPAADDVNAREVRVPVTVDGHVTARPVEVDGHMSQPEDPCISPPEGA